MKRLMVAMLSVSACLACLGAGLSDPLHFKTAGFSIQALEAQPGRTTYQALMMFLPPSDGFSPNVNVQIQPYAGTMDEYVALTKKQLVASRFKLIKETKQGEVSVLLEYSGEFDGRSLHWYAKAISNGQAVYLATATATKKQWSSAAARLKECVDSFAIDKVD